MPASWRSGFSRPAPPITSESPDNPTRDALFAGPSRSHSPAVSRSSTTSSGSASGGRSLSSSSSAYSLLSKKMAQQVDEDDADRLSIRSSRTVTGSNNGEASGSSGNTPKGRGRAASTASSVVTARGLRTSSSLVEENAIEPMNLDDNDGPAGAETVSSHKGKERATDAPSSSSVKRQRLRPPSLTESKPTPRRRPSTTQFNNPGSVSSPAMPTLATTTAEDLMPSMRVKSNRPSSTKSAVSSTHPSYSRNATPSASGPSAAVSKSPRIRAIDAANAPDPNTSVATASSESAPSSLSTAVQEDEPVAAPSPPSLPAVHNTNRSWFSLMSRPRPGVPPPEAVEDAASDVAGRVPRPATPEVQRPTPPLAETDMDPSVAPEMAMTESPSNPAPATTSATHTVGTERSAPPLSWREWAWSGRRAGGPEPASLSDDTAASANAVSESPAHIDAAASHEAEPDSQMTDVPPEESEVDSRAAAGREKGWLGSWWSTNGSVQPGAALAAQRKREAWALKLAADRAASARAIEAPPASEAAPPSIEPMGERPTTTAIADSQQQGDVALSTAPQPLRKKASESWNALSRSIAASSVGLSGISPSKSLLSLRVPFSGLGANGSSAASTRSHESSHATGTAPSSPQLLPQSEHNPVKPLTGSIRSSTPRRSDTAIFDPPPPVENLVLPTFGDTFLRPPRSFAPKRSTLTRAVSVVSAYLFLRHPNEEAPTSPTLASARQLAGIDGKDMLVEMKNDPAERLPKALEVMGEAPRLEKVKRVVTIGIHGWFTSSNMIKSVLGEQTGTSVKFATMMHDAVHAFLADREVGSFNIQAIALEGQGEVEHRIDKLYTQLVTKKEWLQAIRMADAVFFATHSQGAVVTTQLIARMLDQGLIRGQQAHLLAMCGIAQGPFVYLYQSMALAPYFNYVESAPARELFDFQNPDSIAAIKFLEALRIILHAGVKITTIASLNDQVVPLYSALFSGVAHPGILRAVYIDSDAFRTSDFLANLIVFSIRLRNAGLSDHDLVYHVSEALAGALTGVGHSKIYEEEDVYKLAVRYHFETTHVTEAPTHLDVRAHAPALSMSFNPRDRRNPYLLTWALRGIIEDPQVRELFGNELLALREAYETWRPQTKVLKDVKLKLEGIRMMNWKSGKL
ncbi:hypothetical protein JCM10908_005349 [Rhodotorula pacifica]|uniref:uncharacterized protein n=1 Tax=Rhodotorula pacifica TaxID=1495444 RepID=UPI00317436C9